MQQGDFFQHFRKNNPVRSNQTAKAPAVFFQILEDEHGAYINVIDKAGKALAVNYLNYNGPIRNTLRSIDQIQQKNSFIVDWEKPSEYIYLNDYQYLLSQLSQCDNIVDSNLRSLSFDTEEAVLKLVIQHKKDKRRNNIIVSS